MRAARSDRTSSSMRMVNGSTRIDVLESQKRSRRNNSSMRPLARDALQLAGSTKRGLTVSLNDSRRKRPRHPERSSGSQFAQLEILRSAQDDEPRDSVHLCRGSQGAGDCGSAHGLAAQTKRQRDGTEADAVAVM